MSEFIESRLDTFNGNLQLVEQASMLEDESVMNFEQRFGNLVHNIGEVAVSTANNIRKRLAVTLGLGVLSLGIGGAYDLATEGQAFAKSTLITNPSKFPAKPSYLENNFINVFEQGVALPIDQGIQRIESQTIIAHSVTTKASCQPYYPNPEDKSNAIVNNNQFEEYNLKGSSIMNCPKDGGTTNRVGITHAPLNGPHAICDFAPKEEPDCRDMNLTPGLIKDGILAANSVDIVPNQYGQAYKMIFDKFLTRARIYYAEGDNPGVRQLEEIMIQRVQIKNDSTHKTTKGFKVQEYWYANS